MFFFVIYGWCGLRGVGSGSERIAHSCSAVQREGRGISMNNGRREARPSREVECGWGKKRKESIKWCCEMELGNEGQRTKCPRRFNRFGGTFTVREPAVQL